MSDAAEEEAAQRDASREADADALPVDAADGDVVEEPVPLPDAGPPVPAIATGIGTCVVQAKGNLKCWGMYPGDGGFAGSSTAADMLGLAGPVVGVGLGPSIVYARLQDDSLQVWGSTTNAGTLGLGINGIVLTPTTVTDLHHQVAYATGSATNACAVLTNGGLKCWGFNTYGGLGNGKTGGVEPSPVDVVGLAGNVVTVDVGNWFSCAALSIGAVQCWGVGWGGQLGDGVGDDSATPVTVAGIANATAVACGDDHACALLSTGAVKCWGDQSYGQLGDGVMGDGSSDPVSLVPVDVIGLQSGVVAISADGYGATCALLSTGGVKCWGRNQTGQIGDGTTTPRSTPTDVVGLQSGVISVSASLRKSCALMANGSAKCWGTDWLGDPNAPNPSLTPIDVVGLP